MRTILVTEGKGARGTRSSFCDDVVPAAAFLDSLIEATSESLWFLQNCDILERMIESKDQRLFDHQWSVKKHSRICLFEDVSLRLYRILEGLFKEIIVLSGESTLSMEEISEVLKDPNPENFVIGGQIDRFAKTLSLVRGDLSKFIVPLSIFRKSGTGLAPNFSEFAIDDHGQTLKFGEYEASVDSVLYEFDPLYRRESKKKLIKEDKSFGACLRRLRLQKGLKQTDFPDVDPRQIGRIERGEISRPHKATIASIAASLGVDVQEIETY